jgi:hypothetical protein
MFAGRLESSQIKTMEQKIGFYHNYVFYSSLLIMINFPLKSKVFKCGSIVFFLIFTIISFGYSQTDTIILNNKKIACTVKEITPDAVKYTDSGGVINSVYKNAVQKIIFKSGRVQTFAEATSFKRINGVMDYDKVAITSVENEIAGLYKLGEVSSKAKGTTKFSNEEKVKQRAYRKFKIEAAMLGGNVIYISNQRTEGNKFGTYHDGGVAASTYLTGIAYSNTLPDYNNFKKLIGTRTNFGAVKEYKLSASASDVAQDDINKPFRILKISNENGIIYLQGDLEGAKNINRFQLASFTSNNFSVAYKYEGTAYNVVIKLN